MSGQHDALKAQFKALLDRNQARWIGIARTYASSDDRDDLVQEMMTQVWKSLPGFKGESQIDTWAYRVAINTALAWKRKSHQRKNKLNQKTNNLDDTTAPHHSYHKEMQIIDGFMASLSPADRVVMLLYLDGMDHDEAADVAGISAATLRVRLHRLRIKFQDFYRENGASQ